MLVFVAKGLISGWEKGLSSLRMQSLQKKLEIHGMGEENFEEAEKGFRAARV